MRDLKREGIYKLYNGEYIDLSKLVTVKVEFGGHIFPDKVSPNDGEWTTSGKWFIECNFEFIKDPIKSYDIERVFGNGEWREREIFMNVELQKIIKAWKQYKTDKWLSTGVNGSI